MDIFLGLLCGLGCFALGISSGISIQKARTTRKARLAIEAETAVIVDYTKTTVPLTTDPNRPKYNEFRNHTVEELIEAKKFLEEQYAYHVHWPILRQEDVKKLKQVLEMLEWHYDADGSRQIEAKRAETKRELAEFDQRYAAALRSAS